MALLDLGTLGRAPLMRDPFTFTVVADFVDPASAEAIRGDFPAIGHSGLLRHRISAGVKRTFAHAEPS